MHLYFCSCYLKGHINQSLMSEHSYQKGKEGLNYEKSLLFSNVDAFNNTVDNIFYLLVS